MFGRNRHHLKSFRPAYGHLHIHTRPSVDPDQAARDEAEKARFIRENGVLKVRNKHGYQTMQRVKE